MTMLVPLASAGPFMAMALTVGRTPEGLASDQKPIPAGVAGGGWVAGSGAPASAGSLIDAPAGTEAVADRTSSAIISRITRRVLRAWDSMGGLLYPGTIGTTSAVPIERGLYL